ncbi:M20/M25/M40 family metallo-hydrolase [Sphingomonas sp.]
MRLARPIALLLLSASALAHAQTATPSGPAAVITPDAVRAHVEFLADDLLEGRDAGTRGYDIAARYVASEFRKLGLQPANGDGWYQQVPLEQRYTGDPAGAALTVGGRRFAHGRDAVTRLNRPDAQPVEGEAVFVGYGVVSPSRGIDDYAGLDVRGKTVVLLYGTPADTPEDEAERLLERKAEIALEKGAASVVTVFPEAMLKQFSWKSIVAEVSGSQTSLRSSTETTPRPAISAIAGPNAARALFAGAPQGYDAVMKAVAANRPVKGFALAQPVRIEATGGTREFTSPNVVGMIPGSDPALANEVVLLTAHLDHNGKHGDGPDQIYNGAMDNAAGTATMIEAARAFMASDRRPRRTVMFVALTAEEDGLLGSEYMADHPVDPTKNVVAVVNLDMPILLYDFTDVVAFGAEHSTMGPVVASAAGTEGVTLSPDPMPQENLFMRSDHYSFVKRGVPSVFLVTGHANGGAKAFKDFLSTHYHRPSDDLNLPFNWPAGAKFARVNYAIADALANADQPPRWYADSRYGQQFAPDAPKAPRPK